MADVADAEARGTTSAGTAAAAGFSVDYTNFEAATLYMCVCDYGAFGADCSVKMCPRGDNPATTHQTDFTFVVTTDSGGGGTLGGVLRFWFNGQVTAVTLTADGTASSSALCGATFSSLPNIALAHCTLVAVVSGTKAATYVIRLSQFVNVGFQNNVHMHNGTQLLPELACDVSAATSSSGSAVCGITAFDTTLTASGTYSGSAATVFTVEVADDTTNPNMFFYRQDGGTASGQLPMSASASPAGGLGGQGVTIAWNSVVGHTLVRGARGPTLSAPGVWRDPHVVSLLRRAGRAVAGDRPCFRRASHDHIFVLRARVQFLRGQRLVRFQYRNLLLRCRLWCDCARAAVAHTRTCELPATFF
jgi:hypothetical protein